MDLTKLTDEQLKAELEAREAKRKADAIPQQKKEINWQPLLNHLHEGIVNMVEDDGYPGKDFDHYVFETAMECVYGKDVWKWYNEHYNG